MQGSISPVNLHAYAQHVALVREEVRAIFVECGRMWAVLTLVEELRAVCPL